MKGQDFPNRRFHLGGQTGSPDDNTVNLDYSLPPLEAWASAVGIGLKTALTLRPPLLFGYYPRAIKTSGGVGGYWLEAEQIADLRLSIFD
jgi:hypothetical protein